MVTGARYTEQDISVAVTLEFPHPVNERNINIDGGDSWMHGFAGLRLFQKLGEKWTFVGRADYGYGGPNNTAFDAYQQGPLLGLSFHF